MSPDLGRKPMTMTNLEPNWLSTIFVATTYGWCCGMIVLGSITSFKFLACMAKKAVNPMTSKTTNTRNLTMTPHNSAKNLLMKSNLRNQFKQKLCNGLSKLLVTLHRNGVSNGFKFKPLEIGNKAPEA